MNLSGLLKIFGQLSLFQELVDDIGKTANNETNLAALHLPASVRAAVLARLITERRKPTLIVVGRPEAVPLLQQALETWMPPHTDILRFPEPTALPYERAPWSENARIGRMSVLTRLMAGQHPLLPANQTAPIIITSVRALLHKTIPKRNLMTTLRRIKLNERIDLNKTLQRWTDIGYERVTVVEAPCQFSHRGGIIDIYPPSVPYPVRIELFGDEVDTLRYFDPATQRSVAGDVKHVIVPPAREALPKEAKRAGDVLAVDMPPKFDDFPAWQDDVPDLIAGSVTPHLEYYLQLMYPKPASLLDYVSAETDIFVDDWVELTAAVRSLEGITAQLKNEQTQLPKNFPSPLFAWDTLMGKLMERGVSVLGEVKEEPSPPPENAPLELVDLIQPGPRFGGQERPFLTTLQRVQELEQLTVVVSRQAQRLAELYRQTKKFSTIDRQAGQLLPLEAIIELPEKGRLLFVAGSLNEGFSLEDFHGNTLLHLLTDAEIFGWNRPASRRRRAKRAVAPETYFSDIEVGDYIVHIEFGIGQFMGMVVRTIGGNSREYLQLNYANNDVLYIPVHHADRLSKWIGSEFQNPSLHRVGEKRWTTAKQKAQKSVDELADELLALYAAREMINGHAFAPDNEWQIDLEASFPYSETEDQLTAIQQVKGDMERPQPMDRLICGDVGFGKTEVALRAAFKAVMDEKQVAILVPTTVLAQQHYNTFRKRLTAFPVEVGLLSRFQSQQKMAQTVKGLRDGSVDIAIGTHRILSNDISFKDLGLLIIDEEQRFGVGHKEKLKQLRTEVDVLTMTATPIPRTMYMGLAGLRDISVIETPPNERLPIQTYVGPADENLIKKAILRELERGGQIYFVHNHVMTIQNAKKMLENLVPEVRIEVGHGQMAENQLERVMTRFAAHEIDILVCTTIIESGLDIPNANTLIVDRAELFGLSQMYQLRGRVGRGTQRAYAYFFHSAWWSITPEARARLETIDEHTDLGAGYSIAMRDLEIRGAGELLGGNQSGHIATVGFDLYMRMLARAVKARKAAKEGIVISAEIPTAVTIDVPLAAYIPVDYVPDASLRLRLYRRMAGLESMAEIDKMNEELVDRFGPVPDPINNLLYQLRIKVLSTQAQHISSVATEAGQLRIRMTNLEYVDRINLQHYLGNGVRVSKTAIWFDPNLATKEWKVRLVQVLEKLVESAEKSRVIPLQK